MAFASAVLAAAVIPVSGCGGSANAQREQTVAELPHSSDYRIGVQTHFGQNWQADRLQLGQRLPVARLRDGLSWASVERDQGELRFPESQLRIFRTACAAGMRLTMTIVPRNPLYEQNNVVATPGGRAAFLGYLEALLDRLPGCIEALEIGNEINGAGALPVAEGLSGPEVYVELMKAIYAPLKRKAPDVTILGGSTNVIGTGFLDRLFHLGLLDHADAVAVHPYRDHGENVDWELRHLAQVMARHGKVLPVWATEFSDNFDRAEHAAPALMKMVTLLGAAGVERAHWYALTDQEWFRHMGLFDTSGRMKPAAEAFTFIQRELTPHGRPEFASDSRLLQLYRFGADRWVAWGAPREANVPQGGQAFAATGERISGSVRIGTDPVVFSGPRPSFGRSAVLADSLLEYGHNPWSYHVRPPGAAEKALAPLDEQFATRMGDRYSRPLFLSDTGGAAAGTRDRPLKAVVRFTPTDPMSARLQVCLIPNATGEGLVVAIERNGSELYGKEVHGPERLVTELLDLEADETLDLVLAPAGNSQRGNTFRYRVRLLDPQLPEPPCPAAGAGWSDT